MWFDENKIKIFGQYDAFHVCREDGAACTQTNTIPTMEHGGGNIKVWECFAYSGTEELRILDSTMKITTYIKNLEDWLQSLVKKLKQGLDWVLQQDNYPKQTDVVTRAWLEDNSIRV